jgi:putative DNA primase/helicase
LLEVFDHDPIMVSYIQRAVGYSLTGDSREQCFFLCWGGGRNGKSTLLEVLKHVLGTYSLVLPFTSFIVKSASVIPNDLALLPGKRFVVAKESPKAATLDEAMIKQLTGSDHISARFLHREFFEFKPVAKIWLAANHKPLIRDETNSIWRRVHLIPFTQRFEGEKCDETLTDKLIAESAGILAWAVEGCALWQASGLQPPETVLNARSEYREESDPVGRFLAEACEIGEGYSVPVAQVREAYQSWAGDNGEMAASYWECSNRLKSRGFVSKEIGHEKVRHWLGFRLKNGACRGYDAGVFAGMPEPTQPAAL